MAIANANANANANPNGSDKPFCSDPTGDEETVHESAKLSEFPATKVTWVRGGIGRMTAI